MDDISSSERDQFEDPVWGGEQLGKISLFGYYEKNELEELYGLGRLRTVPSKAHVIIEGEPTRGLYIVLKGTVSVYKMDPSTKTLMRLAFLEKGAVFGELSLLDATPRSATITAETTCYLFSLDFEPFQGFLEKHGAEIKARFYQRCAEEMAERFRTQNSDYITSQKLLWQYALRRNEAEEESAS